MHEKEYIWMMTLRSLIGEVFAKLQNASTASRNGDQNVLTLRGSLPIQ